jgi:hypothetical protein
MASRMRPLGLSVCPEIWNTPRINDRIYMKLYVVSRRFTKLCQQISIVVKNGQKRTRCVSVFFLVSRTAQSDGLAE